MRTTLTAPLSAAALAATLLVLGACSSDQDAESEHNDADVTFAQQMIPHHQQAIEMSELAESRASSQEVKDLAADIEAAQGPEIDTMTGWLEEWDEDVPDSGMSGMDHSGHDMSSDGSGMAGMMSEEDMTALEAASGAEFDQMFLAMMIEHHEGAIEMAQTEQAEGEFEAAVELAAEIESAQTSEIETMQELLAS
jgi:uncharacterized protein (DUF305 family)